MGNSVNSDNIIKLIKRLVNKLFGLRIARGKKRIEEQARRREYSDDALKQAILFIETISFLSAKEKDAARKSLEKRPTMERARQELEKIAAQLDYEARRKFMYLASVKTGIPLVKPRNISVDTATACNLKCRICHQWKDKNEFKKLETADLKKLIDEMTSWCPDAVLEFSGQEPLLNKELLLESLAYAKGKVKTAVSTNGILLNEENAAALLKAGPSHISVSVDGFKKETHDYIRNLDGAHDKTISGIRNLVKAKKDLGAKTAIAVTFVITDTNIDEMIPAYNFLKELGVDCISYNPYTVDNSYFFNPDASYNNNEFWVKEHNLQKLTEAIDKVLRLKKESPKPLIINSDEQLTRIPKYFELKDEFNKEICYAGYNYFHITNFGEATVCGKGPQLNIKDMSLEQMWNSANFWKTRKKTMECRQPCLNNCFELL